MTDLDARRVVIGLYRHDVPEEETPRRLLKWLAARSSYAESPVRPQTSIEEARERMSMAQFALEWAAWARGEGTAPQPGGEFLDHRRLDEATIDRIVRSNNWFPERIQVTAPVFLPALSRNLSPYCSLVVGYADQMPDDVRADGRRLVSLEVRVDRVSPARAENEPDGEAKLEPSAPLSAERLRNAEILTSAYVSDERITYATIQHGRPLPDPRTLAETSDPRDFDRICVQFAPAEFVSLAVLLAGCADWKLEGLSNLIRLSCTNLSANGETVMNRMREMVLARFH